MAFCLPERILSCLETMESTGGILKSVCSYFLGGAFSSVCKVGLGGISGSTWVLLKVVWGSLGNVCSVGKFDVRGQRMAGCGLGSSIIIGRCFSDRVA